MLSFLRDEAINMLSEIFCKVNHYYCKTSPAACEFCSGVMKKCVWLVSLAGIRIFLYL